MANDGKPTKPKYVSPAVGKRGMTPLHYAAYCNDATGVQEELLRGAEVDARDDGGWTPLHWSIDMSQAGGDAVAVVELLLAEGASANAVDKSGFSVLMMACGRNDLRALNLLIKSGADLRYRSPTSTPLHEAAACNFHEAISVLLASGVDPLQRDDRSRTAEELAAECGFERCVALLRKASSPGQD